MNFIASWPRSIRLAIALLVGAAGIASARTPQPIFERDAFRVPQPTGFAQCPQFFPNGKPPAVPASPCLTMMKAGLQSSSQKFSEILERQASVFSEDHCALRKTHGTLLMFSQMPQCVIEDIEGLH